MAKTPVQISRGEARAQQIPLARSGQRDAESRLVIRGPVSGRRLTSFALPDADDHPVNTRSYRQRANLILFFHHGSRCPDCRATLRGLAENLATFREEESVVLGIGPDLPSVNQQLAHAIDCPFPMLSDPSGHAVARQGLDVPTVVVADRYGEIWAAWDGGKEHQLPKGPEIIRWLEFVELQCPECGVAEWPPAPCDVIMET